MFSRFRNREATLSWQHASLAVFTGKDFFEYFANLAWSTKLWSGGTKIESGNTIKVGKRRVNFLAP